MNKQCDLENVRNTEPCDGLPVMEWRQIRTWDHEHQKLVPVGPFPWLVRCHRHGAMLDPDLVEIRPIAW